MMSKVYFIIPVYNVEKYVKRCVDSVLNQSAPNVFAVLIDDGSTDASGRICDSYKDRENVTVIHKENGGLSSARNAGLRFCRGVCGEDDFIAFLDSDDFIREDFAEKMLKVTELFDCEIAECAHEKGESGIFSAQKKKGREFVQNSGDALLGYDLKSCCTAKIFRFSVIKDIDFKEGVINEDEFYTWKAVYKSRRVGYTTERLMYYSVRETSIMATLVKSIKGNPHKDDWVYAYVERYLFFEECGEQEQALKTLEKIGRDIILRYCEQRGVKKEERAEEIINGEYVRAYRNFYRMFSVRKGIPKKQRAMYKIFYYFPYFAFIAGKLITIRK